MKIKHAGMVRQQGLIKLTILVDGDPSVIAEQVMGANEDPDERPWELEFKKYRKRRSLDANAYMWVLVDKLAEKLGANKEDVYREAIRDIPGVWQFACVQMKDADALARIWRSRGIGWQVDEIPSKIEGCKTLIFYKGSSEFDSKQMSMLIDYLVQQCKEQGIETMSPHELARLEGMV